MAAELICTKACTISAGYIFNHVGDWFVILFGGFWMESAFQSTGNAGLRSWELDIPESQVASREPAQYFITFSRPIWPCREVWAKRRFVRVAWRVLGRNWPFRGGIEGFQNDTMRQVSPSHLRVTWWLRPGSEKPITKTISVNPSSDYKVIGFINPDFQDGRTKLEFQSMNLFAPNAEAKPLAGAIYQSGVPGWRW